MSNHFDPSESSVRSVSPVCAHCGGTGTAMGARLLADSSYGDKAGDPCPHYGLFSDSGPLDRTHYCTGCRTHVPNRDL